MSDELIRPRNAVLMIGLQSAVDAPVILSAATDAIPFEEGSFTNNSPFSTEDSTEITGSLVAGAPQVIGQPGTFSFNTRIKGAGAGIVYTASVKPPLHNALSACGMRPQFTAAIAAAALSAGTTSSATLGTGFNTTAEAYRGMPLVLSGGPGAGRMPLVVGYSAAKVALLSDLYSAVLTTATLAAMPANWTYAGTSPADPTARATDQPYATVEYYEDGIRKRWINCRGIFEAEGKSARVGIAKFSFSGVYMGEADASVPNAVLASHSAPLLVKGSSLPPVVQVNRRPLPIGSWSLANGGQIETPDDPNTEAGFGPGEIGGRKPIFQGDPLKTLVATRSTLSEIAAFAQYPIALQHGMTAGNRWSMLHAVAQPIEATDAMRGSFRSETTRWQALNPGNDAYGRDGETILCFS